MREGRELVFRVGEIVRYLAWRRVGHGRDLDAVRVRAVVRFRNEDGLYYVQDLELEPGFEYMGFRVHWRRSEELERLDGELLRKTRLFERAHRVGADGRDTHEWYGQKVDLFAVLDMEEVGKECRTSCERCRCILPTVLVTLRGGERFKVFGCDARFIRAVIREATGEVVGRLAASEDQGTLRNWS